MNERQSLPRKRWSEEEKRAAAKRYGEGESVAQIARDFGCSESAVTKVAFRLGITRPECKPKPKPAKKTSTARKDYDTDTSPMDKKDNRLKLLIDERIAWQEEHPKPWYL